MEQMNGRGRVNRTKKIVFINYPMVIFEDGTGMPISEIKGNPTVGKSVDFEGNIVASAIDSDCVSGVCPNK